MKTAQIVALLHFQMPVTWKYMCQNHKKIGEARKTAPEHCVEFQSNSFFRFRCCHYTSICKYADIFEPTESEQEFSAKMNISAIFDSAISVCKAFFSNT